MISGKPARWLPRVLLLAAILAAPLTGANAQEVRAEGGSIAVGGNVSNSTIGLTPEQIRDAMAAVFREESATRAEVEALSDKLNVTNEAVVTFLRILGENQVPLEKLPETLGVIAERHVEMLDRLAALAPEDPEINAEVEAARTAIKEGDYNRADQLLSEAEDAERAAITMAEELAREARAAADRRRLNAAAARAERGEIALTQLDYLRAAGHFEQASKLVPADDDDQRGDYLNRYADALYRHGDERGDNVALLSALDVCRQALEVLPRNRVPLDWARTQMNLGNALATLGERESGTARLEEAVAAYRAALEEWTRERVPLQWARTQTNLGNALQTLGARESGTARLQEAVEAYRAALEEFTRERVPLQWATVQMNLGTALLSLGVRIQDRAKLEEAREAVSGAFAVYMQAGQEHHRADFEDLLREIDDHRAQLQATLKAR